VLRVAGSPWRQKPPDVALGWRQLASMAGSWQQLLLLLQVVRVR
jgi:hypothetical protein